MSSNRHVVIIGNGIAGVTCARNLRKLDDKVRITLVSGESKYFFSRTALMYVYMGQMKFEHIQPYENWFWEKNRLELKEEWVKEIDYSSKQLVFQSGGNLAYDELVISVGSKPNKFGWPGQDLKGVQGLYSKQDLELMEESTQTGVSRAVITGGGLIGIEMAEMLMYKKIAVTFLVREPSFWGNILPKEESELVGRHMLEHHIDLRLESEVDEIIGDKSGRVKAVRTKSGEEIACQFVGLTAGVSPNIDFLKGSELALNRGVKVNLNFQTNIPNVYSIGDCAEFDQAPGADRRLIEQIWYTGRMHGETLAYTLAGRPTGYKPGPLFNSAKFLDIEYQTYGNVPASWDSSQIDSFYWEHSGGKIAFRILMDKSGNLVGVNNFGFRLRHEFFDKALTEKWSGIKVISKLDQANFDTEFFAPYYIEIQKEFKKQFGGDFTISKPSFIQKLFGARI
jgi:NAD(P)H-nitrite reductase large subunit